MAASQCTQRRKQHWTETGRFTKDFGILWHFRFVVQDSMNFSAKEKSALDLRQPIRIAVGELGQVLDDVQLEYLQDCTISFQV